jgi:hypothetical protein
VIRLALRRSSHSGDKASHRITRFEKERKMKRKIRTAGFWLVLVAACLCTAQILQAQSAKVPASGNNNPLAGVALSGGCGLSPDVAPAVPVRPQREPGQTNGESKQPSLVLIAARDDQDSSQAGIVGTWHGKWTAQTTSPSGVFPTLPFEFDAGYSQWHSDGTEFNNSAGRRPSIGNVCLGVWKQTGPRTYILNHFGASFDDSVSPATLLGPAQIRQWITLSPDGNSYSGTFTVDQYDEAGNHLVGIAGTITATRITVTTPESSIF